MDLIKHIHFVKNKRKENLKFFKKLNNTKPKVLDKVINSSHETVFKGVIVWSVLVLQTTSPLFTDKDIQRISNFLKIKPSIFVEKYLFLDDDNDYVLKSLPCVFLNDNNECRIYKVRPRKRVEIILTQDRVKQYQLLKLTQKNIEICPKVSQIIERIKLKLN